MRFVLTYRGLLPPNGTPIEKHVVRKQLHEQLKRQWEVEPGLSELLAAKMTEDEFNNVKEVQNYSALPVGIEFTRGPFSFVPLVV
jgi:hypothetical protein